MVPTRGVGALTTIFLAVHAGIVALNENKEFPLVSAYAIATKVLGLRLDSSS